MERDQPKKDNTEELACKVAQNIELTRPFILELRKFETTIEKRLLKWKETLENGS